MNNTSTIKTNMPVKISVPVASSAIATNAQMR